MNYGFDPLHYNFKKKTPPPYDEVIRRMFDRRESTTLVPKKKGLGNLKTLIDSYLQSGSVTRPIDNLLLGGHGSDQGKFELPMFAGQTGPTTYERVQETIDTLSKSVKIPTGVLNTSRPQNVHLKGCNMGKAPLFLAKMKEALGANVTGLTAPKHFHALSQDTSLGIFEHMDYQFSVRRPEELADRDALIAAFVAAAKEFTFIDGSNPVADDFTGWIPEGADVENGDHWTVPTTLGATIGPRSTLGVKRELVVDRKSGFVQPFNYSSAAAVPAPDKRRAAFQDLLPQLRTFKALFPMYERLGYKDIPDFMAGFIWNFDSVKKNKTGVVWTVKGTRVQYTIIVPITVRDPTTKKDTGQLVFNFYPNRTSSYKAITRMAEDDGKFFQTA